MRLKKFLKSLIIGPILILVAGVVFVLAVTLPILVLIDPNVMGE